MKYLITTIVLFLTYTSFSQENLQFKLKELFTYQGIKYSIDIETVSMYNYEFWLQTDYPDGKTIISKMKMSCAKKEYDATNFAVFKDGKKLQSGNLEKYEQKIQKDSIFEMILNHICLNE